MSLSGESWTFSSPLNGFLLFSLPNVCLPRNLVSSHIPLIILRISGVISFHLMIIWWLCKAFVHYTCKVHYGGLVRWRRGIRVGENRKSQKHGQDCHHRCHTASLVKKRAKLKGRDIPTSSRLLKNTFFFYTISGRDRDVECRLVPGGEPGRD